MNDKTKILAIFLVFLLVFNIFYIISFTNSLNSQSISIDTKIFTSNEDDLYTEYVNILNKNNPNRDDLRRINSILLQFMYNNIKNNQKSYNKVKILFKNNK